MEQGGYCDEIRDAKYELEKERRKLYDERVERNKTIRQEARKESFLEMVQRIICEDVSPVEWEYEHVPFWTADGNDLLCHLTDIHTGIEIDSYFNKFDRTVLEQRLQKYMDSVFEIQETHNSEYCYLVIGEIVSGIIHNNLRLQNNMDLMEQFKLISEMISYMLIEFAKRFSHVYVYTTPGNHSRISPKKEDSLDGENMDVLLPFYLKAKLQNIRNIHIEENVVDTEVAIFKVRDNLVYAAHGHKDKPENIVQNWTMMLGEKPAICMLGHRHVNRLTTVYDTKVIESGSVSGTDAFAQSIRKVNKPEQTISVIDSSGLRCLYDVQL